MLLASVSAMALVAASEQGVVTPALAAKPTPVATAHTEVVKQYCVTCHSDRAKARGLSLASFDAAPGREAARESRR